MTAEEILVRIIEKLKIHTPKKDETTDNAPFMGQEPYKGDIFELFIIAYENDYFNVSSNPRLTGDAIKEIVITRWMPDNDSNYKNKERIIAKFYSMWNEWKYSLDKYSELN